MKCDAVQDRLSAYLDGEAPEIEPHLKECAGCRAALESLRRADDLLAEAADRFATPAASNAVKVMGRVRRRTFLKRVASVAAILLAGFIGYWIHYNGRTSDPQEVVVIGAEKWVSGAQGVLRVLVRDARAAAPVAGARIRATLGRASVEATSGADGSAEVRLPSPEITPAILTIVVSSSAGSDTIERQITVDRPVRLLLSTDKPLYQPSQTIHLRALTLNRFTMKPFQGEVVLEAEDPNGNRVWKRTLSSSDFGIASADFALADEVTFGTYRLRATAGGASSERTVEVKKYVLPRFKIEMQPDRGFYAPGDPLRLDLEARYTFGKPVAQGEVQVELSTWVGDKFETIQKLTTRADAAGKASVEAKLPDKFFGTDLARGDAVLRIEAAVTDGAGHSERKAITSTVTREPIRVQVFPESGEWVEGVPGRMYIVTSYPDGRPAKTTVEIPGRGLHETDEQGVLRVPIGPPQFTLSVRDARGNRGGIRADLLSFRAQQDFILQTDKVSYRAGGTMEASIVSARDGIIYLDLVKSDQTLLTKSLEVRGGKAKLAVDLPAELFGTVRLSAYRIDGVGQILRDSRVVVVDLPGDLKIRPTLKKNEFKPGEEIEVDFEVLDANGKPVAAALGLAVVDEAVFALHESRPGLEKIYFQIEEELLKPRIQLKEVGPLAGGPVSPIRTAIAPKPEITPLATVLSETKAWELERCKHEFNEAAVAIVTGLIVVGTIGGLIWLVSFLKIWRPALIVGGSLLLLLLVVIPGLLSSQRAANEPRPSFAVPRAEVPSIVKAPPEPTKGEMRAGDAQAPRIRQFFPETLYWNPQLITDERGRASLKFPGADSITTWRMAMSAVTRGGRLGSGEQPIRVFQPFFVDIDLPVALTQGDEVWLPLAVYNYLPEPQTIALTFEAESGFEVIGEREKRIDVRPDDVTAVRFHVRARQFGRHSFLVKAIGTQFSDAVRRSIDVVPDGKEIPISVSNRLTGTSRSTVTIPADAIDGASKLWVRLFPSTFSEIVTGLEGLVRMPYG